MGMPLDQRQLGKPIRKLEKAIRKLPKLPTPEQVHDLRTQSRRLETTVRALNLDRTGRGRRLLKYLAPLRKAAGKVRDADVLTGLASTVSQRKEEPGAEVDQLIEELGAKRLRFAARLHNLAAGSKKEILQALKHFSDRLDRWIEQTQKPKAGGQPGRAHPAAFVISHSAALSAQESLGPSNLHSYRLAVKELRYALELAQDSDERLLRSLRRTKDAIGEWHDWSELERRARKLHFSSDLVRQIHSIADQKLGSALRIATDLQSRYFPAEKDKRLKRSGPLRIKEPILISAARMSA